MNKRKLIKGISLALAVTMAAGVMAGCSQKETPGSSSAPSSAASSSSASSSASSTASGEESSSSATVGFEEGLTEQGYYENVKALDYVTLPEDYASQAVPDGVEEITEEKVQEVIDSLLASYSTTEEDKESEIKAGDSVNIDYVGSVDGVEFDGGSTSGKGTTVTAGDTNYIDDFLDQIIGHKPGDSFDVNVTFPENYGKEELNGKDAVFKTTINYITISSAPEFNDEFVKEHGEGFWDSAAALKADILEYLTKDAKGTAIFDVLAQSVKPAEVPQEMSDYCIRNLTNGYTMMANQYGMTLEDYLGQQQSGLTMEAVLEQSKDSLNEKAKDLLTLQAISEKANIQVTEKDLAMYTVMNLNSFNYPQVTAAYGTPYFNCIVRETLAAQALAG